MGTIGFWEDRQNPATLGGLGLLILAFIRILAGPPNVLAPYSVFLFLPSLYLGPLAAFIPSLAFWIFGFSLFSGKAQIPFWFVLFVGAIGILNCLWLYWAWSAGVGYEGPFLTALVASLSIVTYLIAVIFVVWSRSHPSFKSHFRGVWIFFLWLTLFSFPLFGIRI